MNPWPDWDSVPSVISKEQFYQICHISKATARKLLQSGAVHCNYNGRKTHCYEIRKRDVLRYLHQQGFYPDAEDAGSWKSGRRPNSVGLPRFLPEETAEKLRRYYEALLIRLPDVVTTHDIVSLTGYAKSTVNSWCSSGLLPHLYQKRTNYVPKVFLISFFCSDFFRNISRKTRWHLRTLRDFSYRLHEEARRKKRGAGRG